MTRADYVVVLFALWLLPYLYITYWGSGSLGERVEIRVAGAKPVILALDHDKRLSIEGTLGTSVIEIRDQQVRFIDAPCQGKRCVMSGWLDHDGDTAICMPNGVSIQVLGQDQRFDAVNF